MKKIIVVAAVFAVLLQVTFLYGQPEDISTLETSGSLSGCNISIGDTHVTKKITIGYAKSHPVHTKTHIRFDNSGGKSFSPDCTAYIYNSENESSMVTLGRPKYGIAPIKWHGTIEAGENNSIQLVAWDGPKLAAGAPATLVVNIKDGSGNSIWLKSETTKVKGQPIRQDPTLPEDDMMEY